MILTYNIIKEPYETRKELNFGPIVLLFDVGGPGHRRLQMFWQPNKKQRMSNVSLKIVLMSLVTFCLYDHSY